MLYTWILFIFGLVLMSPLSFVFGATCDPDQVSALGSYQGCEQHSTQFQNNCVAQGGTPTVVDSEFMTFDDFGGSYRGITGSGLMCSGDPVVTMECVCGTTPVPTLTFTAADYDVVWGTDTTLFWSSTNAESCTASGDWSGPVPTSGSSETNNIWSDKTYTLECTGPGGSVSKSVTVTWHLLPQATTDQVPVGVLDGASCSLVFGWTYDPDTTQTNPPTTNPPAAKAGCWQTPSAPRVDGYARCQTYGACTVGDAPKNAKCLDTNGNLIQPSGQDWCVESPSVDDVDCNRSTDVASLSCTVGINEPANALNISSMLGGSRVIGQQASADFACQQLGYTHAVYFSTRGFKSCGDNGLAYVQNGGWQYGNACALGNSGINYVQCRGSGSICQNKCGNGIIDPGEECDGSSSTNENRCGDPTWYCTSSCRIRTNNVESRTECP